MDVSLQRELLAPGDDAVPGDGKPPEPRGLVRQCLSRAWATLVGFMPLVQTIQQNCQCVWKHGQGDFMAGLTIAVILIPQGLAYAQLAGLPAIYGPVRRNRHPSSRPRP